MENTNTAQEINPDSNWNLLFICWLIATGSTLGSLFFSKVLDFPPCVLCWYQRICLFPLVPVLLAGLFPLHKDVVKFALPLAIMGWFLSAYHNLLYTGFIAPALQPCGEGASCTEVHLGLFGFVTIPMLSFLAFTMLSVLLLILHKKLSI